LKQFLDGTSAQYKLFSAIQFTAEEKKEICTKCIKLVG